MMDLCNFPFKGQNSRWDNRAKEKDGVVMDKEGRRGWKITISASSKTLFQCSVGFIVTSMELQKDLLILSCLISFPNTHSSKVLHLCFTNLQQWQNALLSLQHSHILCPSPSWHQILGVERAQQDAWCKGQAGRKVHQHQKGPRPYNVTTQLGV